MYIDGSLRAPAGLDKLGLPALLVEMVAELVLAAKRLTKVLGKLAVDRKRMPGKLREHEPNGDRRASTFF